MPSNVEILSGKSKIPCSGVDSSMVNPNIYSGPDNFSPSVANYWAELIVRHWRACNAAGEINPSAPLDILDFVPGQGNSIWLMVRALSACIKSNPDLSLNFRYLPVVSDRNWVKILRTSSEMQNYLDHKIIIPLLWNRTNPQACLLFPNERKIWEAKNPVILLTHGLWSHFPQRLLAVHYGKLMEADLSLLVEEFLPSESKSALWKNFDRQFLPEKLSKVIDQYLSQFNSVPLPYPQVLLDFLTTLTALPSKAFLLLSAAHGYASMRSMRMGNFQDMIAQLKNTKNAQKLPLNFQLINHYCRELGGVTGEIEIQNNLVLQMGLFGHINAENRLNLLLDSVNTAMFEHAPALSKAIKLIGSKDSLGSRLALIKLSQYDPDVFVAGHEGLLIELQNLPQFDRSEWRITLERIWSNQIPGCNFSELYRKLATAAMYCGHWMLARKVLSKGMEICGINLTDRVHLAWCDARTGHLKNAFRKIDSVLKQDAEHSLALEVRKRILARLSSWDGKWLDSFTNFEKNIVLEPLDNSHAEAFFLQYRDPQIAIMTGLPLLNSIEKVRSWIDEQNSEIGRINFAIMHFDFGFIGYINLSISEHAAYFCFWTGVDFQGNGFATIAARMAFELAKNHGITLFLTSAYSDNARSIRALHQLGFVEVSVRALPPDNDRIFYFLASENHKFSQSMVDEVLSYYSRENLPLNFFQP